MARQIDALIETWRTIRDRSHSALKSTPIDQRKPAFDALVAQSKQLTT
jgi:hypothetical protein